MDELLFTPAGGDRCRLPPSNVGSAMFGIPWVRRPFDYGTGAGSGVVKQVVATGMKLMRPQFAKALTGLRMTDHFTGFGLTGTQTLEGK